MSLSVPHFLAAVGLLFAAHLLRCLRQTLLFPQRMLPWRFDLLLGLALGYLVNVLLPWRAGDLVRVGYIAARYRVRLSYVAATVLAERLSDIAVVASVFAALLALGIGPAGTLRAAVLTLLSIGAVMLAFALAVARSRRARRAVRLAAAIFNERIRFGLLDLGWSFSQLVTASALLRRDYVLLTCGMWTLYFASYALLAAAAGYSLLEVSLVLLSGPERSLLQQLAESGPLQAGAGGAQQPDGWLLLFTALPVLAVLLYGAVRGSQRVWRSWGLMRRYGFESRGIAQPIAGDRFTDWHNYWAFLDSHFTGADTIVSKFGLMASPNVLVHRLLPGGSDAVTALVEVGEALKIRKCASGGAGDKLREQAGWLRQHADALPLATVIGDGRSGTVYSYDMPYLISARDFYEVIHTAPIDQSERVLEDVVEQVHRFHRATQQPEATADVIDAYLRQKVVANAQHVLRFASALLPDPAYRINGVAHDLSEWQVLLDLDWLRAQVTSRTTAVVHGDLTIENIIVSSETGRGWYLIDPNPGNVFDTPLIDWAKLMQSLHLGYEGLNRASQSSLQGSDLRVMFLKSGAYATLHEFLAERLRARLGAERMREVAFHELVNYLRLTPYKIRQDPQKALTFFACASILLRRYVGVQSPAASAASMRPALG